MDPSTVLAYAIFTGYFALIAASFALVFMSIGSSGRPVEALLEMRPFAFLRTAIGALLCTWYFMFQFMKWSYLSYREAQAESSTIGEWLVHTSLFEQAWRAVCVGDANWWWSSWICTAAVFLAACIWCESARRGIRYPWAYMLLGQLVAISVAMALFFAAVFMYEKRPIHPKAPLALWALLLGALLVEGVMPRYAGTPQFMPALGAIHLAVFVPLFFVPSNEVGEKKSFADVGFKRLYLILAVIATVVHWGNTKRVVDDLPEGMATKVLTDTVLSHPAQGSVSLDVVWVFIVLAVLFFVTGSSTVVMIKCGFLGAAAAVGLAKYFGVNWLLIASCLPILLLLAVGSAAWGLSRVRRRNAANRDRILSRMGIREDTVLPGTKTTPPRSVRRRLVVGFWHPYCNAGGGGERVLWTAIAWIQREDPDVVILVYSGDYPAASKAEILRRVKDRFSIQISPATLEFIPLPSRYLISDTYWHRFTLLGQSLGSIYLAWEGLCGKSGMWGDIFIDSMGYGFVLPFVRLVTGGECAIGAYTHYPTVSADMVKRVRERSAAGVENGGVASSAWRTQAKLIYYYLFTHLYSLALLFSEHTMTNSSWTQAHIQSLLTSAKSSVAASLLLMDEAAYAARETRGEATPDQRPMCEVVYPPCDTRQLAALGGLSSRKREVVSLAQFRPEKDHAKQLRALRILLDAHPEYAAGPRMVHLTLMGGSRGPVDEARLSDLRALAKELDLEQHVTFLVNAPYAEIVKRLGEASIGLNTMQDEHFGINVVEFMAAGLIPVVHASAGPLLDIVVPHNGQKTGFHATDAESFAAALHEALSLTPTQALDMRTAARALANERFSEAAFEAGFARGWERLVHRAEERLGATQLLTKEGNRAPQYTVLKQ